MYLHTNGNQLTLTDYQIIKWYNERLRSSSSTMLSTHIPHFQQLSCSVHTVIQLRCTQLWRIKHTKMSSSQALWSVAESHVQINFFRSRILYLQINSIIVFFHLGIFEAFSLSQMRKIVPHHSLKMFILLIKTSAIEVMLCCKDHNFHFQ